MITTDKVKVSLRNVDGNAFAILGRVQSELRRQGRSDLYEAFYAEATSGDYNNLLRAVGKHFEIEMEAPQSNEKPERDEEGICEECTSDDDYCNCFKCGDCGEWAGNTYDDEWAREEHGVCYECSTNYSDDEDED